MVAVFSGFAKGLAQSSIGNLPQLLVQKEQLQVAREERNRLKSYRTDMSTMLGEGDFDAASERAISEGDLAALPAIAGKRDQTQRKAVSEAYAAGGLPAVRETTLGIGRADLLDAYEIREHNAELRPLSIGQAEANLGATQASTDAARGTAGRAADRHAGILEADKLTNLANRRGLERTELTELARSIEAGLGPAPTAEHAEAFLTRMAQDNSKAFARAFKLGSGRQIVGVDVVPDPQRPDDPLVALQVFNPGTKSVGPETARKSADPDDQVNYMRMSDVRRMLRQEAGIKTTGVGKWKSLPGGKGLYNEGTSQVKRFRPTDWEVRKEQRDWVDIMSDPKTGLMSSLDIDQTAYKAQLGMIASVLYEMGHENWQSIGNVAASLITKDNRFREMVMHGATVDEQEAGVQALFQHLGVLPPAQVAATAAPGSQRGAGDTHPGDVMPVPPAAVSASPQNRLRAGNVPATLSGPGTPMDIVIPPAQAMPPVPGVPPAQAGPGTRLRPDEMPVPDYGMGEVLYRGGQWVR